MAGNLAKNVDLDNLDLEKIVTDWTWRKLLPISSLPKTRILIQ
jgi:hypothetical protein